MACTCVQVECVIRGYHVYKREWNPEIGEKFETEVEDFNEHDRYAVSVQVDNQTVGHMPREVSKICHYFIKHGGEITGQAIGKRQRSIVSMKGLEIPCKYNFTSRHKKHITRLVKLLKEKTAASNLTLKIL